MRIIRSSDELHIHAHLIIGFLNTTFQEIGNTKLFGNFRKFPRFVLVTLCGRARDHFEIRNF